MILKWLLNNNTFNNMLLNFCFSPLHLLFQRVLKREPRSVEGKLLFLPYNRKKKKYAQS